MSDLERVLRELAAAPASFDRWRDGAECPDEHAIAALALGRLGEREAAGVRAHLALCGACVADARAALEESARERADAPPEPASRPRGLVRPLLWAAAAAAVLLAVVRPWQDGAPDRAELAAIARLEALPVRVPRGPGDPLELLVREGLALYAEGELAAASARLDQAAERAPERADVALYQGSAALLSGRPADARAALERAAADPGDLGLEARWQLAQAHLALGEAEAARALLAPLAAADGPRARAAREQLEALER